MKRYPIIRPIRLDDLDEIMAIEHEIFIDAWTRQSYIYEITENKYSLPLVMLLDKKIIGHAVCWHVFDEFHLATIGIRKSEQGKGFGQYLLQACLGMTDGAEFVLLEVRKSNIPAIKMYEKNGFIPLRIRHNYYKDGEDAIVMRKQLY